MTKRLTVRIVYEGAAKHKQSFPSSAFNPRLHRRRSPDDQEVEGEVEESGEDGGHIVVFGENPGWDKGWVKAYKINVTGQVRRRECLRAKPHLPTSLKIFFLK